MPEFKPNIYPIMYWGLMYGLVAGLLLFALLLLSRFITIVWFPVFVAGVIWGGYRNYTKQKNSSGQSQPPKTPLEDFKEAASDIVGATRDMIREQMQQTAQPMTPEETATTDDSIPDETEPLQSETGNLAETPPTTPEPNQPIVPPPPAPPLRDDVNNQPPITTQQ
mgnify:CR=1 FL=1